MCYDSENFFENHDKIRHPEPIFFLEIYNLIHLYTCNSFHTNVNYKIIVFDKNIYYFEKFQ